VIGSGSYGQVFQARHRKSGDMVAIKMVPVDDDQGADALEHEIDVLKKVDSQFCVGYLGTYELEGMVWIVMEYAEAGSVADLMNFCKRTLEEEEIKDVTAFVLLGLEYLHNRSIIHRDIKAGNILLNKDGQAKLADFGVAAQLSTLHSRRSTMTGAPFWMAPEVMQETRYRERCDIWSLGITIIEMAQGKPPHHDVHPMRVVFVIPQKPPPTLEKPEEYSPEMSDFLSCCLQKDPGARPSATDLMSHPFVADRTSHISSNSMKSEIIADLVKNCMPQIEAGRSAEAKSSEGSTLPSSLQDTLRTASTK